MDDTQGQARLRNLRGQIDDDHVSPPQDTRPSTRPRVNQDAERGLTSIRAVSCIFR